MKMNRKLLAALLSSYYSLGVGAPLSGIPQGLQIDGNIVEPGSLISILNAEIAAQVAGTSQQFATSAAASLTLTSLQNLWQRFTNGGAVTVTLDYAYNIVNALVNPFVGQSFPMMISTNAGTTIAAPTLLDTAVTLSGTTTLLAAAARWYQGLVTQVVTTSGAPVTAGTNFSSLAQVSTGNGYTLTNSGNSLSPTVGQAVFLNVTAGTLPSGWYPIVKVTSATVWIIAAPIAGTAWTMTAGTIPGTTAIPTSQYTPGLAGVYSPLLTLTGMAATVTASISV